MKKIFPLIAIVFCIHFAFGQNMATGPIVRYPIYFDVSPPLKDMVKIVPPKADNSLKVIKNFFNVKKNRNREIFSPDWVDPIVQRTINRMTTSPDSTIQNFLGGTNTQGYDPPDTYGNVGLSDYFQIVNCHFSIYSKTGTLLSGPTSTMTIWNGMPNNYNGGDGVVLYDAIADRWLIAQLSYSGNQNWEMIAVSQTNDPTGSWYRWQYAFGTTLPDYPKFGVWPDGYYMSANLFLMPSGTYQGTEQCVYNRTAMLAGNSTAQMVSFTLPSSNNAYSFLPSTCDGAFPPSGTPNYFVYMNDAPDCLGVYEFHVDWSDTSNSTFGNCLQLTVSTFNDNINSIPQKGTSTPAEVLSDRLMYRLQFRTFSDHWSMVFNHTVNAGSNVAGIRWYELRKTTGNWGIYQQSTYAPSDNNCRWMGSMAMDTAGNMGLGFSISSSNIYPAIKFTGRMKNDPLNTMDLPEKGIYYGTGSNTANDGNVSGYCRWGDYSSMTIDPSDGMTFWYTQQYFTSMGSNWQSRIASFQLSGLNVTASANPQYINQGQTSQLSCTATGGTGIYTYSWTSIPAGFTSNQQNPPPVSPNFTTRYVAHVTSGTQTATDTTIVYVNMTATATANPYTINPGGSSQLNVTATGGTGTYTYSWTSSPAGFSSNLQNPIVSPIVTTIYTAVATSGTQNASDTAKVKVNMVVHATATPDTIQAGQTSQLNAIANGGSGNYSYTWTSNPPGFNSNLQNPVVSPLVTTRYILNVNDGTQSKADSVLVTVIYIPMVVTATATPSIVCIGSTSQLNVTTTGGTGNYTYSWTSIPPGFTSNIQNPMVQPIVTTIYVAAVYDGIATMTDSTTVTVIQLPTAFAGDDTTICVQIGQIQLNGQSTSSSSVLWTTSGDGVFLNPTSLTAIYYPGVNDKSSFHVSLTLTASPVAPCTSQATSTMHITFDPCTGIPETGNDGFSISIRPNPSYGLINLVVTGLKTGGVAVNIMELSGKVVYQETFATTGSKINRSIDLSQFQKGVYFVKVETDTQVKTEKLIIE